MKNNRLIVLTLSLVLGCADVHSMFRRTAGRYTSAPVSAAMHEAARMAEPAGIAGMRQQMRASIQAQMDAMRRQSVRAGRALKFYTPRAIVGATGLSGAGGVGYVKGVGMFDVVDPNVISEQQAALLSQMENAEALMPIDQVDKFEQWSDVYKRIYENYLKTLSREALEAEYASLIKEKIKHEREDFLTKESSRFIKESKAPFWSSAQSAQQKKRQAAENLHLSLKMFDQASADEYQKIEHIGEFSSQRLIDKLKSVKPEMLWRDTAKRMGDVGWGESWKPSIKFPHAVHAKEFNPLVVAVKDYSH